MSRYPPSGGGQKPEPEMERLSNIIREFNDRFGNIEWKDPDKIKKVVSEELPAKVAGDRAYQNAMANSDQQNARIEHDKALERAMTEYPGRPQLNCSSSSATTIRSAGGSWRPTSPLPTTDLNPLLARYDRPCQSRRADVQFAKGMTVVRHWLQLTFITLPRYWERVE